MFSSKILAMRRMVALCLGLACVALDVTWVRAQPQAAIRPEFDAASIKPTKFSPGLMGVQFLPGGRMIVAQSPVPLLITAAYDISQEQLEWPKSLPMVEELYNIEAKAPSSAIPPGSTDRVMRQQLALMLQSLLADRFKLRLPFPGRAMVFPVVPRAGPSARRSTCQTLRTTCRCCFDGMWLIAPALVETSISDCLHGVAGLK